MENQANSKSIILNYGLITGGASVFIALIAFAMGNSANPGIPLTILGFLVPTILIVLGIKKFKSINGGFLSWGQAVKIGVGISLVWAVIALTFQFILENYIDPTILEQKIELTRTALENWGMDQDVIDEQIEKQRNQSPLLTNAMGLMMIAFIGFVISAIAGAIMKESSENEY